MSAAGKERSWTLSVAAAGDGVQVEIGLPDIGGQPYTAILALDRDEARTLARALLAASGDAMERTFPRLPSGDDQIPTRPRPGRRGTLVPRGSIGAAH